MTYHHDDRTLNEVGLLNSLFNVVMIAGLLGFVALSVCLAS